MNENHSHTELKYKPRWLATLLRKAVKDHPIIVLTGARQVGKSTLLRQELPFSKWRYHTLDDLEVLARAKQDPTSLWAGAHRIILDEVQKSANLLEAVKAEVDANPGKCRFILSGSANLLLMKKISESLARRAVYFILAPMTIGELNALPPPNLLPSLFAGHFPDERKITSYLVERLPAYAVSRNKRLVKSPKLVWSDSGLASFLAGHFAADALKASRDAGGLFESLIHLHLNALGQLLTPKPRLFYWRTTTGKEVDFILEWGRKMIAIEVKLSNRPQISDTETLRTFLEEYPETIAGVLVHTGNDVKMMSQKIIAVPWPLLGGF